MTNVTLNLEDLNHEMDQLGQEIEHDRAALEAKMQRRNMLVEFLMLADKLRIEHPPSSVPNGNPQLPITMVAPGVGSTVAYSSGRTAVRWPQTIHAGIHEVMREGGIWGPKDLATAMLQRGWHSESSTPETIIANQLGRLSKDPASPVRRLDYGRYVYSAEPTEGVV